MNKRGFTLVELLAVMAIIAIISVIAVPNVMKIMDNNKKDKWLNDAQGIIALAKYEVASDIDLRNRITNTGENKYLKDLDKKNDFMNDPNGEAYSKTNSYVRISKGEDGVIVYCIYLEANSTFLGSGDKSNKSCVLENIILSDNAKMYVKDNESS